MPTIDMKTELPGPTSRAIIARKERAVCDPLDLHVNAVIDHGIGAAVTDVDGNTMLDLSTGLGCLLVGHSSVAAMIFEPELGEGGYVVPGSSFLPGVERLCREHGILRGLGSMIGVEMVSDRGTKEPDGAYVGRLMAETQRRGLITVSCGVYQNVLRHLPPLVITDEQLEEALDVLADSALAVRSI